MTQMTASAPRLAPTTWIPGLLLAIGIIALGTAFGPRLAALALVGGAFGVVLYHAAFGFTGAWRVFILERRGRGLRAQMVMLTLAVVLFFPALAAGTLFGTEVDGYVAPVGISVLVGAFLFGLGMQLGSGCASGTLYTVGGGNARMLITLAFFVVGSLIGTAHFSWWTSLPAFQPVSLVDVFGAGGGIAVSVALFAAIAAVTVVAERRRHGRLETTPQHDTQRGSRWLRGPWPLLAGAVGLALLNFITLALAGRPWGITSAFALWGAKAFEALGGEVSQWGYWQLPGNAEALQASLWSDITTVMNLGIILGAMIAASLAGRFAPNLRIPLRSAIAAVIGGLLLGYGARLAFGCNIGAYFGGIASGSLHGWLWLVAAFAGNMLGVKLRPWFFERPRRTMEGR